MNKCLIFVMQTVKYMEQKIAKQKQMNVFQRVLEDKAAIRRSIQKGEDLKEVAKQRGIRFATPL